MDAMRGGGLTLATELTHVEAIVRLHVLTTGQHISCTGAIDGLGDAVLPPRLLPSAVEAVLAASPGGLGPIAISALREGTQLAVAIRVSGEASPPEAVVDWAHRQARAQVQNGVTHVSHGRGAGHWVLRLQVPWRVVPPAGYPEVHAQP